MLPDSVVASDSEVASLTFEVLVERVCPEHGSRRDLIAIAQGSPSLDVDVGLQHAFRANDDVRFYDAKVANYSTGSDDSVRVYARSWSYARRRVY